MKLTNKTGIPTPLMMLAEKCINSHPVFDNNRYSVTELLKSERQIVLSRRYADKIEQDIQDTFGMWSGTAIHEGLEKIVSDHPELSLITEQRFELDLGDGLELSGGFDLYDKESNILYDYKTTKVATYNSNLSGKETKWVKQLYMYTLGIEKLFGKKPDKVIIVAMLKDQSKVKASVDSGHPQHPIMMIEWDMKDIEKFSEAFIEAKNKAVRIREMIINGEEPPLCSYEDCWCTEDWCIKKPGAKKADKKFNNAEEAYEYYTSLPIEKQQERRVFHRVSDFKNCRDYCTCSEFCSQWQANKEHEAFEEDVTDDLAFDYIPF